MGVFRTIRRRAASRDRMTLEITTEFDYGELEDDLDDIENKAENFAPVFERSGALRQRSRSVSLK